MQQIQITSLPQKMATKIAPGPEMVSFADTIDCSQKVEKVDITSRQFNWSMYFIIATVCVLIYAGDPESPIKGVKLTASFEKCLDEQTPARAVVEEVEKWINEHKQHINAIEEVIPRWAMLSEIVGGQEKVSMAGLVSFRGEWATYLSVLDCTSEPFNDATECRLSGTRFVAELWSQRVMGDMLMRRYAFTPATATDKAHAKLLSASQLPEDPRRALWYNNAIAGTIHGQWQKVVADSPTAAQNGDSVTSFSRTFRHNKGTTVIPGEPGGGVIVAAVDAGRVACSNQ